ncbi:hypothetical protein TRFO_18534 [Tritrichomonas foetus]|uniref:Uncharacterized protein n=1 Tax=Tritrichomonas foetus TaxID=1144522 RepID=A0A1J4KQ83_9EUKA|nr:hypothetical protein TRFO_18534 [Tritrichomonas foetus]|eukprot:OHT11854.1 hypothetical protein TRFO_18534 [Tritrichomonas foetus]
MNVFAERKEHLRDMVNMLISEIENDYFIPQMLVHQKSADFIPERITEIFFDLIDQEFFQFTAFVTGSLEDVKTETHSSSVILDQDKISNHRTVNILKLQNKQFKMDCDVNSSKLENLKQQGKRNIDEINHKLKQIENSINNIHKNSSKLRVSLQKMETNIQSERELFEETIKTQKFEMKQYMQQALDQIRSSADDYQMVKTQSKSKLKKMVDSYQMKNQSLVNSMNQIMFLFGSSIDSNSDVQAQITLFLKNIYHPLVIADKHIRTDSIERSIERYLKRKDLVHQEEIMKIRKMEEKLENEIEHAHARKVCSPLNLRAIYANRKKQSIAKTTKRVEFRFE